MRRLGFRLCRVSARCSHMFSNCRVFIAVSILQSVCVDSVWNRVSRALGNLALDLRNCVIIHRSGAISSLIHVLRSSQDAGCLHSCLRSLRILADSLPHRLSICDQGGLPPCISLLSSTDPALVCCAVRAVCELSRGCSLDAAEQLSPVVPHLVVLAGDDLKAAVRQAALGTLCNLCGQGALRPVLGNAGTIKLLIVEAEAQRSVPSRCLHVLKALSLCCREAVNRLRLRELGGLELMLSLLRDCQYRSMHSRITAAFLHFCHDTAALNVLGTGGLAPLLAQRLGELAQNTEPIGELQKPREVTHEEEDRAAASFDFPPEKMKRTRESTSEDSLRSWLVGEGILCGLEDLAVDDFPSSMNMAAPSSFPISPTASSARLQSHSILQCNRPLEVEQRTPASPACIDPIPSTSSPQLGHSPIQEILGSPWPFEPRTPLPSECCHPEFPGLLLLSRFSQLSDLSSSLVCPQVLQGLLTYVTRHPHPSQRAARLLQRLTCDPSCLEAFIRTGSICNLRARLLLCESPEDDGLECNRHPEGTRELGNLLLRNLCIQAESPFGVGAVTHMMVSGTEADRLQCALSLPFIYRKDSLRRQLLRDGAVRLVLEPLSSSDLVYFFHALECLASLTAPQTVPEPCQHLGLSTKLCCYQQVMSKGVSDVMFVLDGGECIEGVRKAMTEGCEVFRAMLDGNYAESGQRQVRVCEVPSCAFVPLLHYIHGCKVGSVCPAFQDLALPSPGQDLAQSPLGSLLAAAGRFLLSAFQRELEVSILQRQLSLDILPSVYSFAELHGSSALRRDCCQFLLKSHHPPRKRASSLYQLYQTANDKQRLSCLIEDIVQDTD
uniref:BTB domain-containing protein n=1 Tax=Leptobrachium leishanense TaxID=445787 RepID=A0A8C5Q8F9_9ANUR